MVKCLNSYLLFVFFAFGIRESIAQNPKIDSLLNVLKNAKEDTEKVNIFFKLSEECEEADILKYAKPAFDLAKKINFKSGMANSLNNIGFVYMSNRQFDTAKYYYETALKIRLEIYNECKLNNEKLTVVAEIITAIFSLAYIYKNTSSYNIAIDYYSRALVLSKVIHNKLLLSKSLHNLGDIYDSQGKIEKALEYYSEELKINESINEKILIGNCLNGIGYIYNNQNQTEKALEYFNRSIKIKLESGDKKGLGTTYNNVGLIYRNKGENQKALFYYEKSLKIRKENRDGPAVVNSLINIAGVYFVLLNEERTDTVRSRLEKSTFFYLNKAFKTAEAIQDKNGMSYSLNNLATFFNKQKRYKEAEAAGKQSLNMAQQIGLPMNIRNAGNTMSEIYKSVGNYKGAYEMHVLFKQMADSVNNAETQKASVKKQMQYDFDKKEAETKAEQDKKDMIANEEKQKQKVIIASISVGLILVLILAIVILRSLVQNQKKNRIITEQKLIVEHQKELVEEKQKEILDSIHYAKRIQTALITSEKYISKHLAKLQVQ